MIVIADSSPIRYLVLIQQAHCLPLLYETITVSPGVVAELTHQSTPLLVRQWMENYPDWLTIRQPRTSLPELSEILGLGEREAIALAEELKADVVLADDGAARQEAARRGIAVQGTLGVLDLAAEHGLADFEAAVKQLRQTNFRASPRLIRFFLERNERRKGAAPGSI